jgi:glucokinase
MYSGTHNSYPRLVGDVGGTNARFATIPAPGQEPQASATLRCADYPDIALAIEHYLAQHAPARPRWAAIGIANPVMGDRVQMTNHNWSFSIDAVKQTLRFERLLVLNDFTALALALPSLKPEELHQVGGGTAQPHQPKALLGAGTGLGVSGLIPHGEHYIPISGEGGHVTLPGQDAEEIAVIAQLGKKFAHVSAERVLSGPGLEHLYQALSAVRGASAHKLAAEQITARALDGSDEICVAAANMFCALLGTVSGNLALTLGAHGGVYIGGGIVPKLGSLFIKSSFRQRFESKGRFTEYLARIPVFVIHARYPALTGAAAALEIDQN